MTKLRVLFIAVLALCLGAGMVTAATITLKVSGEGAANDSTIIAGKPVSVDFWWENDKDGRRGFTTGFRVFSEDIKKIIHVADSGNGLNDQGDIKGHNGWEGTEVWDFAGMWTPLPDWDGNLPDTIGFGATTVHKRYMKHPNQKVLSFEIIVPETGTLRIDSTFTRPGGYWKFVNDEKPVWTGPYAFKVIKDTGAKPVEAKAEGKAESKAEEKVKEDKTE